MFEPLATPGIPSVYEAASMVFLVQFTPLLKSVLII